MTNSKSYKIGSKEILLPLDHALDQYQSTWKRYDVALGYISGFVFKKYPSSSFIDIGANVGDSAALVRNYSSVPILAIEGSPDFFPYLEHNSIVIQGVVCAACFVGAEDLISSASIQYSVGTASIKEEVSGGSNSSASEKIRVLPLSQILENYQEFKQAKLLKIDTDGFDFSIIDGSLGVISNQLPVLFFEYDITFKEDAHNDSIQTMKSLCDIGYRRFLIYDNYGNFLLSLSSDNLEQVSDLTAYLLSNRYTTGSIAVYYFDICAFPECDIDICDAIRDYELSLALQSRERLSASLEPESNLVQPPILDAPSIVIDGVFFQISNTGIARVWSSLLKEWSKTEFSKRIIVLDRAKTAPRIEGIIYRDVYPYNYDDVETDRQLIQSICDEENALLFISTYYTTPLTTASVFMAYDMIPEVMNHDFSLPMWKEKARAIELSSFYFAISKSTANDLVKYYPSVKRDAIDIAYCAVSHELKRSDASVIRQFRFDYSIQKPYFILVGHRVSINGYKNTIVFFKALSGILSRAEFDVVCVGPISGLEPELSRYVDGYNVHTLQLNDEDLQAAYSGAIALIYPSKYEGFGLPIIEAMACECPVITCHLSSIPEVAGDAAIFINPDSVAEMQTALLDIQKPELRDQLIKKGLRQVKKFSWMTTANIMSARLLEHISLLSEVSEFDKTVAQPIIDLDLKSIYLDQELLGSSINFLRETRLRVAKTYLALSIDQLKISHLGILGKAHQKICQLQATLSQSTEVEIEFIDSLSLENSIFDPIARLLVLMLYQRADQLDLLIELSEIPLWLLDSYLDFIYARPALFTELGEINSYIDFMTGWLESLYENSLQQVDSKNLNSIVCMTIQRLNSMPLYFTEKNVKNFFEIRARLVEFHLREKGHQLDCIFPERSPEKKRIRVGILALYLIPQTETFATLPLYQSLNRNDFEIILITTLQTGHRLERYCFGQVDMNVNLPANLSDQVAHIRSLDLDIIFISTNITLVTNEILLMSAHRLARVQICGMNSPTTTGLKNMDYYLSSSLSNPCFSISNHYSEKIIHLNCAAQAFDFATERFMENDQLISRDDIGINNTAIVYCSGANFHKITPELEQNWAAIIAAVPNSVLMLYPFNPNWSEHYPIALFYDRVSQSFLNHGIDLNRLVILDASPSRDIVINRLRIADIYLDSYPFSGMTSLIDPLLLNIPTIVMEMDSACSLARGSAFLREIKADNLIAHNEQSYFEIAVRIGLDSSFRQNIKSTIRSGVEQHPSFINSDLYGAEIEKIFKELIREYKINEPYKYPETSGNVVIFPDWNLDEEALVKSMISPIRSVFINKEIICNNLIIYIGEQDTEYADLLISSVFMDLASEDEIEASDNFPSVEFWDSSVVETSLNVDELYSRLSFEGEDRKMSVYFETLIKNHLG
jgi:FkbM family methyltransferase